MTVQTIWLNEFIEKIDSAREVNTALNKWIRKVVFFLEWEAIPLTNIDKWFLRNWYREKFWNLEGTLYNIRDYDIFVHEWTRYMKWNPFLTRTVDQNKKEVEIVMNEDLKNNLTILQ